jgi:hypothetical protein
MKTIALIPSISDIEHLNVGDLALDCFGKMSKVTYISARRIATANTPFVMFYTETGTGNGSVSGVYRAGELVRTVPLSFKLTSNQTKSLEDDMNKKGDRTREIA